MKLYVHELHFLSFPVLEFLSLLFSYPPWGEHVADNLIRYRCFACQKSVSEFLWDLVMNRYLQAFFTMTQVQHVEADSTLTQKLNVVT